MSNLYFVDLCLWPETDEGQPDTSNKPVAHFRGMVPIQSDHFLLVDYEPEELAVLFAEERARLDAGNGYESGDGIAIASEVRPESEAEKLARMGYAPMSFVFFPA